MIFHNCYSTYVELLVHVYRDSVVGVICPHSELQRDIVEIQRRVESEGLSFLTKTLPRMGKAIDTALSTGQALSVPNFKKKKGTQLPQFMRTLTRYLFTDDGIAIAYGDSSSQVLEDTGNGVAPSGHAQSNLCFHSREAAVMALRALRQVLFFYYKLAIPHTREQQEKVITDFVTTDAELALSYAAPPTPHEDWLLTRARHLICRVLGNASPLSGIPRHGPGAVATGEKSPEKHVFKRFYRRLDAYFKYDHWFYLNATHACDSFEELQSLEEFEAGTAKVVLVPKDSRGPRLISCEPLEYQWIQQALMHVLVDTIEKHPLTKGYVNFTDQTVNRCLALEGSSRVNSWVTLDMKEASDRVSMWLVAMLFPDEWVQALYASRSPATTLPDGTVVPLNKFAPMGSAVCFPVEALVFWALSVAAIEGRDGGPAKVLPPVYVYGDDVICAHENHRDVQSVLSKFGLKLNDNKCCTEGSFRESCGMDAFLGHPVTPVRFRTVLHHTKKSSDLPSLVEASNALWERGYRTSAHYIERLVQQNWNHSIPVLSHKDSGVICFVREYASPKAQARNVKFRFNRNLWRHEVKGPRLRSQTLMSTTFGYPILLRILAEKERSLSGTSAIRTAHITGEYAMAKRVKLHSAWTPTRI